MNRYEKRKQAIESAIRGQIEGYKDIYATADKEAREPTEEERLEIESHLRAIDTLKAEKDEVEAQIKTLQGVEDTLRGLGPSVPPLESINGGNGVHFEQDYSAMRGGEPIDRIVRSAEKSIGEQFVESKGFKNVQDRWDRSGRFQFSTAFEVKAGTLTEAAQLGAGLIPVPQVVPGQVTKLFQRLTVEDMLDSGQATTNSIRYVVEGTATSGAAAVAEAAAKPASSLGLSTTDEPVKKLATSLVVSDEMLEDVAQVQSYINGRLSLFVSIQSEASIVNGAGTNDLVGLLQSARGINSMAKGGGVGGTSADNNADSVFKAMTGQRGSAQLEPDFIVMHPTNWQAVRLLRDSTGGTVGAYLGGGPFAGPYGQGQMAGMSGQVTGAQDYLWGKPVIVTTAMTVGSALIGTRAGAQVFSRGGVSVEASNSGYLGGVDLFNSNLVQIRAERRLALAVYRPYAFTLVTGLTSTPI